MERRCLQILYIYVDRVHVSPAMLAAIIEAIDTPIYLPMMLFHRHQRVSRAYRNSSSRTYVLEQSRTMHRTAVSPTIQPIK